MTMDSDSDILSRVPGLEDSSNDDSGSSTTDNGTETGSNDTEHSPTAPLDGVFSNRSREDASREQAAQQTPIIRRHDGLVERQSQSDPRHRDLVDPVTGQIVAHGGIERRVFETAQRASRENQQLKQRVQQLETSHGALQSANSVGTQLGLSPEQQTVAMRVMSDFVRDPVRAIEYMIAEVKAKGYQIPSINGQGQQTDMAAFQRLLDERLGPLMQREQQATQMQQAEVAARKELDSFLEQEPDARANLDVIGSMLQQDRALTLPNAYIRLLRWSAQNGLDPALPLSQQVAARQNPTPGPQPRQPRPLPNGRTMNSGVIPADQRRSFDENTEWSAIIDASMRDAGFQR